MNEIPSMFSFHICLLMMYRKAIDLYKLTLYHTKLLNLFITSRSFVKRGYTVYVLFIYYCWNGKPIEMSDYLFSRTKVNWKYSLLSYNMSWPQSPFPPLLLATSTLFLSPRSKIPLSSLQNSTEQDTVRPCKNPHSEAGQSNPIRSKESQAWQKSQKHICTHC